MMPCVSAAQPLPLLLLAVLLTTTAAVGNGEDRAQVTTAHSFGCVLDSVFGRVFGRDVAGYGVGRSL